MPIDGPKTSPVTPKKGGDSRKPTTEFISTKDNMVTKKTTNGGPGDTGGKQGQFKQPY